MTTSAIYRDNRGRYLTRKDPDAVLDYPFDWSEWLADVNDTLVSAEITAAGVTAEPLGLPVNGVVGVMVSGGAVGVAASVTCRITTAGGRTDDRTLHFVIGER